MDIRKTTILASAIGLVFGAGAAVSQEEPIHGELDTSRQNIERDSRSELERDREDADTEIVRADDEFERDIERQVDEAAEVAERQDEIVKMAEETIDDLRAENESAARLLEEAYGWAVFDTTKGGLIVTGAGGTGVARNLETGEQTFMHVGAAGIGLGAGLENYELVMLLEDRETYDQLVSGQWDGGVSAQAAAGEEGVAAEEQFVDGVRVYRRTDSGLIAQVDVTGMRFWPSEDLNETQHAALDDDAQGGDQENQNLERRETRDLEGDIDVREPIFE